MITFEEVVKKHVKPSPAITKEDRENLKKQAEMTAAKIQVLADDEKLKKLLEIARGKGVVFAVKTAKAMNDPFLLDTLHDILAREGYYQNFIK